MPPHSRAHGQPSKQRPRAEPPRAYDSLMRALIATDVGRLAVDDVVEPIVTPGRVLVRTAFSGVSAGTERRKLYTESLGERDDRDEWPVVGAFGYMAAGEIVAVGDGIAELAVGDRVQVGRPFGGHREIIDADASACVALPDGIDDLTAACMYWAVPPLLGLLAAEPSYYEDAAVVGLGPLGQCAVQLLARVARRVIAIDPIAQRRDLARSLGAGAAFDATDEALDERVREALPDGPEVVLEVSGSQAGLERALAIVRPKGRIAMVGSQRPLKDFDLFWPLQHSGATIVPIHRPGAGSPQGGGPDSPARRYLPDIIDMILRDHLDIAPLITRVVSIDDAPAAFARLHRHPEEIVGMAIDWQT
jgi:threonine dehydrogenase-like Zn-dependent dehydrogenase